MTEMPKKSLYDTKPGDVVYFQHLVARSDELDPVKVTRRTSTQDIVAAGSRWRIDPSEPWMAWPLGMSKTQRLISETFEGATVLEREES